jgi:hypothetical protein
VKLKGNLSVLLIYGGKTIKVSEFKTKGGFNGNKENINVFPLIHFSIFSFQPGKEN